MLIFEEIMLKTKEISISYRKNQFLSFIVR